MRITVLGHGSRYDAVKEALDKAGHELVRSMNPDGIDLIVLANYSAILKKEQYENVKYGAINCHGGWLPKYRGSSVLNWQIINGEKVGGVTILQVDEGIDTGYKILEATFPITLEDTIATVREKSNRLFEKLIVEAVDLVGSGKIDSGEVVLNPQFRFCRSNAIYWHHRKPEDSYVKWNDMKAKQVYDLVRASENPYQVYCYKFSEALMSPTTVVYIPKAKLLQDTFCGVAGRVVRKIDDGVVVIAKDRGVWIRADLKVGDQLW